MKRHGMWRLLSFLFFFILLAACAEDGDGSCAGVNSDIGSYIRDHCYDNWTEAECKDWDEQEINGQSWSFSTKSCAARGFTKDCGSVSVYDYESC